MFSFVFCLLLTSEMLGFTLSRQSFDESNKNSEFLRIHQITDRNELMPDLYFIGMSKCGTSTMARLLTMHPLIVGVGNHKTMWGESRFFQERSMDLSAMATIQTDRALKYLKKSKNTTLIDDILRLVHVE